VKGGSTMRCQDLKVLNLNITEDNYEFKAIFRLCTENACMDVDLERFSKEGIMEEIKSNFNIDEPVEDMKELIMQKVMEATNIKSKDTESNIPESGKYESDIDDKETQRRIDSFNMS
jgi:hypothetical protein